jgi:beta-N-acetylhexosaminidase
MNNPAELRASLRLTAWLSYRYGIAVKNVIGHAESLSSPYHHERVARLKTQTHGDMQHATMVGYRKQLRSFL